MWGRFPVVLGVVTALLGPGTILADANRPSDAEDLIIHELLHSLGLGENPPTSSQISSQVMRRCN